MTSRYRAQVEDQERLARRGHKDESDEATREQEHTALAAIKATFISLHSSSDPQDRGRKFEQVLFELFKLCRLQPRLAYVVGSDQIDGSFSFETDDFLVEAKWRKEPVDRAEADVFAAKIRRRGRNTLGLYVSVTGFTKGFLELPHADGCPFLTFDGDDLFLILDGRIKLHDALRHKRRHLNDTGSCHLPARGLVV